MIKVLVVDDSPLARRVISRILAANDNMEVVRTVGSPAEARPHLGGCDVITLDAHMEPMDGITFLREYMRTSPVPTVLVSSAGHRGSGTRAEALCAGASSVVPKPAGWGDRDLDAFTAELHNAVSRAAASGTGLNACRGKGEQEPLDPAVVAEPLEVLSPEVVALGVSTGGASALRRILPMFPADSPPIVIVDHMPPGYTGEFASQVSQVSSVRVVEARDKDRLLPGTAYLAPGGERHLEVVRQPHGLELALVEDEPDGGHRPSINRLLQSIAESCGHNAAAAVLTGMGRDGASGLLAMRMAGAFTIAQDEATSTVYGMPKAAADINAARVILPLDRIPLRLLQTR
jgi:two-component system chemotaxis response regulator CheB